MDAIATLQSAWVFDKKGELKQTKKQDDKKRAKEIYNIAKEALRYVPVALREGQKFRRVVFSNGRKEWLITLSHKGEITVMQKQEP